jgi:hypothetical protein
LNFPRKVPASRVTSTFCDAPWRRCSITTPSQGRRDFCSNEFCSNAFSLN